MAERTAISWTDHTFNPWIGCQHYGPGCVNCYAEELATRYRKAAWGPRGTRIKTSEKNWQQPWKWNNAAARAGVRQRVFCASWADVFEDWPHDVHDHKGARLWTPRHGYVWDEPIAERPEGDFSHCRPLRLCDLRERLWHTIDFTPWLDWQVLTKRIENVPRMWHAWQPTGSSCRANVWLGCSIANQEDADRNIPRLLECRHLARFLFVSYEPAIGPVDFSPWLPSSDGFVPSPEGPVHVEDGGRGLDWVIVGGESGQHRRPCEVAWIASVVEQCRNAWVGPWPGGVPCFVKQDSALRPGQQGRIPDELWAVKEFPAACGALVSE
ncbi:MAG TPA: DUF5131 family protein [Pirellulales bacterium]|nr:DUF5131 family protein [Pirellulales bacterium]